MRYRGALLALWWLAETVSDVSGIRLVRSNSTGSEGDNYFALQRVGIQTLGTQSQPQTAFDPNSRCLQAGNPIVSMEGIPLSFEECQSPDVSPGVEVDAGMRERQEWKFDTKGAVISKKYPNRCVRRTLCRDQWIYDLGFCLDEAVAVFELSVNMKMTDAVKELGRPLQALMHNGGTCEICGPYRVTQFCKDGRVEGSGYCMREQDEEVGWTRQRSQWIAPTDRGKAAFGNGPAGSTRDLYDIFFNLESPDHVLKSLMGTHSDGLKPLLTEKCGSRVGDGADEESYFYFKKMA